MLSFRSCLQKPDVSRTSQKACKKLYKHIWQEGNVMNICINLSASLFIMSTFFGNPHLNEMKQIEKETVKRLESTYKMHASGSGGGAMFGINTVMLAFTIERPITIEEARAILVGSMEVYLENINKNKAIRPY